MIRPTKNFKTAVLIAAIISLSLWIYAIQQGSPEGASCFGIITLTACLSLFLMHKGI